MKHPADTMEHGASALDAGLAPPPAPPRAGSSSREGRTRFRPAKIALFGLFGCGNSGNDGSLDAMLGFLREVRPDAELLCVCADPDLIGREHAVPTVPIDWSYATLGRSGRLGRVLLKGPGKLLDLIRTIRDLRGTDLMIIPGTGILDDFGERPWHMPYSLLKWCLAARLLGARIAFVSIGAGPINHPVSRWLMRSAARLASYRSYRDSISKDYMASIGLDVSEDPVYPDVAFKLPRPEGADRESPESEPPVVGVGLMSYSGWYNFSDGGADIYATYIEKMTRFVLWLLDRGNHVRILRGETSDQRAIEDVLRTVLTARPGLPAGRIVAEPSSSLHDLMKQIVQTDIVVATRFHNVVCALKLNRPTLSLGYARKNDVLLESFGLGAFCQHVETFDGDLLIDQFQALETRRKHYRSVIEETNARYVALLARQDHGLASKLLGAA